MKKPEGSLVNRCSHQFFKTALLFFFLFLTSMWTYAEVFKLPDTGQTTCYQGVSPYAEIPCAGTVKTPTGVAISGVTMALSGAACGTTTDSLGRYKFSGLGNGSYTVTPSMTGYTFTLTSKAVAISGANITGQNFKGIQ
jgi:hypothetical protein